MAMEHAFYAIKKGSAWTIPIDPEELTSEGALVADFTRFDEKLSLKVDVTISDMQATAQVYLLTLGDVGGYVPARSVKFSGVEPKSQIGLK